MAAHVLAILELPNQKPNPCSENDSRIAKNFYERSQQLNAVVVVVRVVDFESGFIDPNNNNQLIDPLVGVRPITLEQ